MKQPLGNINELQDAIDDQLAGSGEDENDGYQRPVSHSLIDLQHLTKHRPQQQQFQQFNNNPLLSSARRSNPETCTFGNPAQRRPNPDQQVTSTPMAFGARQNANNGTQQARAAPGFGQLPRNAAGSGNGVGGMGARGGQGNVATPMHNNMQGQVGGGGGFGMQAGGGGMAKNGNGSVLRSESLNIRKSSTSGG